MKRFLVVFAIVALIASPAMAADWNFYGSARMSTFSNDVDPGGTAESDQDTTWGLQGNSRIGATVKAGDVGGGFEYGHSSTVNLRKLFGTWNFGAGTLLVGQTYTPVNFFPSNQVWGDDTDLLPYGGVYRGRRPMIQLQFGSFKLAFVEPNAASDLGTGADVDRTFPQIEAAYGFKADMFYANVFGGYQTYEIDNAVGLDVDSYIVGLDAGVTVGPVAIKGSIYTAKNTGPYGLWIDTADDPVVNAAGNDVIDNDTMGYLGVVTFKANDMLTFEIGYGHVESELDQAGAYTDETTSYYANAVITLAPGVMVVPEIGKVDYSDDDNDGAETTYFGAKWQINF